MRRLSCPEGSNVLKLPYNYVEMSLIELTVRLAGPEGRTRPTQFFSDMKVCCQNTCDSTDTLESANKFFCGKDA